MLVNLLIGAIFVGSLQSLLISAVVLILICALILYVLKVLQSPAIFTQVLIVIVVLILILMLVDFAWSNGGRGGVIVTH